MYRFRNFKPDKPASRQRAFSGFFDGFVNRLLLRFRVSVCVLFFSVASAASTQAVATSNYESSADTLMLSLDRAVAMALENNFGIRNVLLDREVATQQVREAWSNVYPQVNATGNYVRNLVTASPFAGSGADDLFAGLGAINWLNYNETVRTDGNPATQPITFEEFQQRQIQGYEQAGITPPFLDDGDIFTVDNQFVASIAVTQTLFNGSAFAAIQGAEQFKKLSEDALHRERQVVIDQVRRAYFSALLASQQVDVLQASIHRLERTLEDVRQITRQGLASRYEELSAEVELVNLETELIQAENQAELAVKNINLLLNLDARKPVVLTGDLTMAALEPVGRLNVEEATSIAINNRPDLQQAEGLVEINRINERINRSAYRPIVSAFANIDYIGRVPDNRTIILSDINDPFQFDSRTRGFFDGNYWNPNVSVGLSVSWNLFSGFQNRARFEQNRIETRRSMEQVQFATNAIRLEVDEALKRLHTAERRIESQRRNSQRAQTNYDFARTRLTEGVGNNLEERQASMLLDQSRLAYLAAIHDYLHAVSNLELVLGVSIDQSMMKDQNTLD